MIIGEVKESGVQVALYCCVCGGKLALPVAWAVLSPDGHKGELRFVHRPCSTDAFLRQQFGSKRVIFLRAEEAFRRLAESLTEPVERPDPVRQKPGALSRAGVGVLDVQRSVRKVRVQ